MVATSFFPLFSLFFPFFCKDFSAAIIDGAFTARPLAVCTPFGIKSDNCEVNNRLGIRKAMGFLFNVLQTT